MQKTNGRSGLRPVSSLKSKLAPLIKDPSIAIGDRKAKNIFSQGNWSELAALIIDWSSSEKTLNQAENLMLDLISIGQLEKVADQLNLFSQLHPAVELFVADAEVRAQKLSPETIQGLYAKIEATGNVDYRLWLSALMAEYHLWQGEFNGLWIAQSVVGQGAEPVARIGRMARSRLKRLLAIGMVLTSTPENPAPDKLVNEIISELDESKIYEEQIATVGLISSVRIFSGSRNDEVQIKILESCSDLEALIGSDREFLTKFALAWAVGAEWDIDRLEQLLSELSQMVPSHRLPPVLKDGYDIINLYLQLHRQGVTSELLSKLHEIFAQNHKTIRFTTSGLFLAGYLLDIGAIEPAIALFKALIDTGEFVITFASKNAVLEIKSRIAIYSDRSEESIKEIQNIVFDWEKAGWHRQVAKLALSVARDCRRVGMLHWEKYFRDLAGKYLPPYNKMTKWEQELFKVPTDVYNPVPNKIKVMEPDLIIERSGRIITLTKTQAHLLALLLLTKKPLRTEWLLENLWPNSESGSALNRLKVTIHRLRKEMGIGNRELFKRDRFGVALVPQTNWQVDYWDFIQDLNGDIESKIHAISQYPLDFCSRQLPYIDELEIFRSESRDLWLKCARELVKSGKVSEEFVDARWRELNNDIS
jgi:hypothetical protein